MEGKLEIKRPVRRLAIITNEQEAMMTRMAHSQGDEDKEKDICYDRAGSQTFLLHGALSVSVVFFTSTPKPEKYLVVQFLKVQII